ncbi:MAG: hypothetical protein ACOYJK_10935, partial [Prevotella sp.]
SKTKCNKRVTLAERCRQPLATLRERLHLSARKKKQPAARQTSVVFFIVFGYAKNNEIVAFLFGFFKYAGTQPMV